jgi:hypothetical protein
MAAKRPTVPELLTIPETAAALKVCEGTVYNLVAAGDLQTTDVAPSGARATKTRVLADSVTALITSRTRTARKLRSA